ncbi:Membrane-associated phospholipid phosphatase [Sinomicrobium oceani]|uniref:Membrane-associated phospholipid phosphatase n=1 Tax=Sinomicrobium oceani TaxID=1150368 RepID=A0A1K1RBX7_9FLAO|nr:phosphatase PAP2 family protein [Sinomicrobium oceani]SFW69425.1 Membrane-associated phospholipid phosphatase [Sinomicrobium oceani]
MTKLCVPVSRLWYVFMACLFLCNVRAQENEPDSLSEGGLTRWQMFKYDGANIFGGMAHAYSRPLHWEGDDWLTFGGVMVGTGLVFLADDQTSDFFVRQGKDMPQFIRDYGWYYGSPQNNYMLTGAVYLTGLFTKNEKWRRTGVLLISSASTAGLLQQVSKMLVGRARPRTGKSKDTFDPFPSDSDYHSFPSGHTILSFTNAYALAKLVNNPWAKAGIYTVGLVPGVSRLWEGAHWLSDVVLSVAISIATVEAIDHYLDSKYDSPYRHKKNKISWNFNVGPGKIGVVGVF